jgi:hypothetical protein
MMATNSPATAVDPGNDRPSRRTRPGPRDLMLVPCLPHKLCMHVGLVVARTGRGEARQGLRGDGSTVTERRSVM